MVEDVLGDTVPQSITSKKQELLVILKILILLKS